MAQIKGEERGDGDWSVPSTDFQESKRSSTQVNMELASKTVSSSHTRSASEKLRNNSKDTDDFFAKLLSERERTKTEERKSVPGFGVDSNEKGLKVSVPHRHAGAGRERRERTLKKNESRLSGHR